MKPSSSIEIPLDNIKEGLRLFLEERKPQTLFDAMESAAENNEARYQLVEGRYYDFEVSSPDYFLGDIGDNIITWHKRNKHLGTIAPNIFVGTLSIPVFRKDNNEKVGDIKLEIQSAKASEVLPIFWTAE